MVSFGPALLGGIGGLLLGSTFNGGSNQEVSTTSTSSQLPPWAEAHLIELANRARNLSYEPYPAFPGQRIEPFSQDELDAFGLTREAAGAYQGDLSNARTTLAGIPTLFDQAQFDQYSSPFTQEVIDQTTADINRSYDIAEDRAADQLIASGNLRGARAGVRLAELDRNRADTLARTLGGLREANYGQALGQFNQDRTFGLNLAQGQSGLGSLTQQLGFQGAAGLTGIGGLQRQLGQTGRDVAYSDFLEQREYPFNRLTQYSNTLRGIPTPTSQQTTTAAPTASPMQQAAGLGIAGLSLLGGAQPNTGLGRTWSRLFG